MYERICMECNQVLDEGFFRGRGICDYCWAIKGLDHHSAKEDITIFGELPSTKLDVNFTGGKKS